LVTSLLTALGVLFYFVFSSKDNNYPKEPITQSALGTESEVSINIQGIKNYEMKDYKFWEISQETSKEEIENMIDKIASKIDLTDQVEGEYYYWSDDQGNYFQYSLLKNILTFSLNEGIDWEEVELSSNSFTIFVKRYFDRDWEYTFNSKQNYPDGLTLYYANRVLTNDVILETTELYSETDYLSIKNGKIMSGRILLTGFLDTQQYLPVIELEDLSEYINSPQYPKSIYFNPGKIASALSIENEYLNDEILQLQQEITNCNAVSNKLVYLYQSFEQEFLTPVLRLDLECSVEYEDEIYSVPAVGYTNAVDPEYIVVGQ